MNASKNIATSADALLEEYLGRKRAISDDGDIASVNGSNSDASSSVGSEAGSKKSKKQHSPTNIGNSKKDPVHPLCTPEAIAKQTFDRLSKDLSSGIKEYTNSENEVLLGKQRIAKAKMDEATNTLKEEVNAAFKKYRNELKKIL